MRRLIRFTKSNTGPISPPCRPLSGRNWNFWVSASSTRNFMMKDPVLDWYKWNLKKSSSNRSNSNQFLNYIMKQGVKFEERVVELLRKKFGSNCNGIISVTTPENAYYSSRSKEKAEETFKLMKQGAYFIHGGVLHNERNKTYGVPDLIVRSDVLHMIANPWGGKPEPFLDNRFISAPHINKPWHYVIVDIKFSTLPLCSNGETILNCNSFPAYKSQLRIYTEALGELQGYIPSKAYILGRKWKCTQRGQTLFGNSCFDRLGVIDYEGFDKQYVKRTQEAVQWIRDCRSVEAKQWNVFDYPLSRPELYPNMSNTHDYPWRKIKEEIAEKNHELTSLWSVGVRERKIAHSKGIYKWSSKRCRATTMDVKGKHTQRVLDEILKTNRGVRNHPRRKIIFSNPIKAVSKLLRKFQVVRPRVIKYDVYPWRYPPSLEGSPLEFYVDFETINNAMTDFESLPLVKTFGKSEEMIFWIGVGYIDPITLRWTYRWFDCDNLTSQSELKMSLEFIKFTENIWNEWKQLIPDKDIGSPFFIHWAPAERIHWDRLRKRHKNVSLPPLKWLDLHQIFKREPITIKGCLGFGLKQVATAMKKLGLIETDWGGSSECVDGASAMLCAWQAYSTKGNKIKEDIKKYNEVDVKVLQEIIRYLRENH